MELTLTPDARPVLGSTINLVTDNIATSTSFAGFLVMGLGRIPAPGTELSAFGMPGCYQHITTDFTNFFIGNKSQCFSGQRKASRYFANQNNYAALTRLIP